jgi:hypothetical protein
MNARWFVPADIFYAESDVERADAEFAKAEKKLAEARLAADTAFSRACKARSKLYDLTKDEALVAERLATEAEERKDAE